MALNFKKPIAPPTEQKQVKTLCFPGETRAAVMSGKRFGIYSHRTKREFQYELAAQNEVIGHARSGKIFIGFLQADELNALVYKPTRVDDPDYSALSIIFNQNWSLLEGGCRLNPDIEWRLYE